MLSRTTHFLASIVALAGFSACSSTYDDVFSFKKNSFKAPPVAKTEIVVPPPTTDPFAMPPGQMPEADPGMTIPGLSEPPPGGIPAPEGAAPPADPGAATIPGL